jgi:RimJ/RimL family protein N-acetyltransferase
LATLRFVEVDPAVSCRSDGLHVAESSRLWIVANRLIDVLRYQELSSEPEAQRWLGWHSLDLALTRTSMVAGPIWAPQPMIPPNVPLLLFAGIERVTTVMVGAVVIDRSDGRADVGGVVDKDYRGQGFGSEILQMVRGIAHRHFGIPRLTAGCESTNEASRRWLATSGFTTIQGPPTHTLPSGRVIQSIWWESIDPDAATTCQQLRRRPASSWRRVFAPGR